jgi:hypothetical protein
VVIGYDPLAGSVDIDFEDGSPQLTFLAERLIVKYYCEHGILFTDLAKGIVEVGLIVSEGEQAGLSVEPSNDRAWWVRMVEV